MQLTILPTLNNVWQTDKHKSLEYDSVQTPQHDGGCLAVKAMS